MPTYRDNLCSETTFSGSYVVIIDKFQKITFPLLKIRLVAAFSAVSMLLANIVTYKLEILVSTYQPLTTAYIGEYRNIINYILSGWHTIQAMLGHSTPYIGEYHKTFLLGWHTKEAL